MKKETNQEEFVDLSEKESRQESNDFTIPEISIEDVFDTSLLPTFNQ